MSRLLIPGMVLLAAAWLACSAPNLTSGGVAAVPTRASNGEDIGPPAAASHLPAPADAPGAGATGGASTAEVPLPSRRGEAGPPPAKQALLPADGSDLPDAPDRDLYRLAAELVPGVPGDIPRVVNPSPVSFDVGRTDTFWLVDLAAQRVYQSEFELRMVTPHAYWYVERGHTVRQGDLERSATVFEEDIYPRVTRAFGEIWSPGIDNDPHLTVLNAQLQGAGGYYTSTDEHPASVLPFSNQREMVYINTVALPVGSPSYHRALAHELQHAIHWNADPSEETWVNEGLAELAASLAGYGQESIYRFLQGGPVSLVIWPLSPSGGGGNYGAASLFMHYLAEHHAPPGGLRPLLETQGDGIEGIDTYLAGRGDGSTFREVFRDWAVANLLDQPQGKYGYSKMAVQARVLKFIDRYSELVSKIPQYSVEYVQLAGFSGPIRVRFRGPSQVPLLPVDPGPQGCWWGNTGDSINATLTRAVDLRGLEGATLDYQVWYSLEDRWDYAYVEASANGGRSWTILETSHTSRENPFGHSFGAGYTGDSQGWISESINLATFLGREILLRFQHITDDAVSGPGLCLRNISVAQIGPAQPDRGWRPEGFILIDRDVRQDYIVQAIEIAAKPRITVMALDQTNAGELLIPAPQELDRLVVAVAALAPKTRELAPYTLSVEPAK